MQILLGALVIVGFYLILFGLRVSETSNLFFGLFCLSVALRPPFHGGGSTKLRGR